MGYHWYEVFSRIRALSTDIYRLDVCFYLLWINAPMLVLSRIKSCHLNRHQCFGECLYLAWIVRVHEITDALVSQQTIFMFIIAPTWECYTSCIGEANYLVRPFLRALMGHKAVAWGHWLAGYPVQFCGEIEGIAVMVKRLSMLVLLMTKNVMAEQGTTLMTIMVSFVIVSIPSLTMKDNEEGYGEEEEIVRRKRWRGKKMEDIYYIESSFSSIFVTFWVLAQTVHLLN